MRNFVALAALVVASSACNNEQACTDLAASSVTVNVTDAADGADLADAVVTYTVDGGDAVDCESLSVGFVCGFEVVGEITVTVSLDGYAPQTETFDIALDADECHVVGEVWDVELALQEL
jgi:hypothetical protein